MALTIENIKAMTAEEVEELTTKYPHLVEIIEKLKEDSNE